MGIKMIVALQAVSLRIIKGLTKGMKMIRAEENKMGTHTTVLLVFTVVSLQGLRKQEEACKGSFSCSGWSGRELCELVRNCYESRERNSTW
jgi:hypothetical protein